MDGIINLIIALLPFFKKKTEEPPDESAAELIAESVPTVKFDDHKAAIQAFLSNEINNGSLAAMKGEGFTLINGFIALYFRSIMTTETVIGGHYVPCVGLVNNKSGQVYTFAFRVMCPDVKI